MLKNLKNYLNIHKKAALTIFVVALFAVAGLVFSRSVNFGKIIPSLTGNMTGIPAEKTNLMALRTPTSKTLVTKKTGQPSAAKVAPVSTLTVGKLPSSTTLGSGENNLIAFSLTADKPGSVSVSKINFRTAGNVTPTQYTLYRGNTPLMTSSTPSFALPMAETIAAGMTQNYRISGTVVGKSTDLHSATAIESGNITIKINQTVSSLPTSVADNLADAYLVTSIEIGDITADQPVSNLPISFGIGKIPAATLPVPPTQATGGTECVVDGGGNTTKSGTSSVTICK